MEMRHSVAFIMIITGHVATIRQSDLQLHHRGDDQSAVSLGVGEVAGENLDGGDHNTGIDVLQAVNDCSTD